MPTIIRGSLRGFLRRGSLALLSGTLVLLPLGVAAEPGGIENGTVTPEGGEFIVPAFLFESEFPFGSLKPVPHWNLPAAAARALMDRGEADHSPAA